MHFGNTLRLLRVEAGVSLRELAGRIGVSGAYLSRVENGHDAPPTPDRLIAIADALGLPAAALVELARQTGPAVDGYVRRTPEAGALFLDIARRSLTGSDIARIKAFIDQEFPLENQARGRLVERLPVGRIVVRVSCSDLEDLLSVAASRLEPQHARAFLAEIVGAERERLTWLGEGFATLVVRTGEGALMLTLAQPLVLADDQKLHVLFVLLGDSEPRLEAIARIARLASYAPAAELCAAPTPERARAILERIESLW
jgi:PTS system nitrogen regulatory IIA component